MGNEITELERDTTIFCTKLPTLACSSLLDNQYIIQITSNFVYVYSDFAPSSPSTDQNINGQLLISHDISDKLDSRIKTAFINELFSGILTEKGSLIVFRFDPSSKSLRFIDSPHLTDLNVSCFTIYRDVTEFFT